MTSEPDLTRQELLAQLRAQVATKEGRLRQTPFPVPAALADLLEGGLKPGSAYCLTGSGSLLHTLLIEPTLAGNWAAVVGMPEFGVEAAAGAGVALERLVLVPAPAEHWLATVAALAEALSVVAVRPFGRVREQEASRLMSRLRDRGATLLVAGAWPRAEARLELGEGRWSGLGAGHGYLTDREVTLSVSTKRQPVARQVRLLLPGHDGKLTPLEPVQLPRADLRAVG